MDTTSLNSLIELPDNIINVVKQSNPTIAEAIANYHQQQHHSSLVSISKLDPQSENFKRNYIYLTEISKAHNRASIIWSK